MTFEEWLPSLGADEDRGIIASTTRAFRPIEPAKSAVRGGEIWPLVLGLAAWLVALYLLGSMFIGPIPVIIVG
jgi:hypothetical protein